MQFLIDFKTFTTVCCFTANSAAVSELLYTGSNTSYFTTLDNAQKKQKKNETNTKKKRN